MTKGVRKMEITLYILSAVSVFLMYIIYAMHTGDIGGAIVYGINTIIIVELIESSILEKGKGDLHDNA